MLQFSFRPALAQVVKEAEAATVALQVAVDVGLNQADLGPLQTNLGAAFGGGEQEHTDSLHYADKNPLKTVNQFVAGWLTFCSRKLEGFPAGLRGPRPANPRI